MLCYYLLFIEEEKISTSKLMLQVHTGKCQVLLINMFSVLESESIVDIVPSN